MATKAQTARIDKLAQLTAIPFTACEVLDALDGVRKTVQGSGIDGAHEACVRIERIRRAIRRTVCRIDRAVTALVRRHEAEGGR